MGVFGIFVGKVLKLLWNSNAGERVCDNLSDYGNACDKVMYCHVLSSS